jgi:Flp pilus assembly protein CpaB
MQTVDVNHKPPRPPKPPRADVRKLVATRRGSALVAGASAALAAAVLLVFLHQYRSSLQLGDKPATVLVARSLIEKGSSGTVIAEKSIFQTAQVRRRDLKNGAIADPSSLRGRVAADDIYPGQQLVIGDFVQATGGVRDRIAGDERAISLPFDNSHGMIGDIQAGDHVDVFAALTSGTGIGASDRTVLTSLLRDLLVLRAPKAATAGTVAGNGNAQQVVVRATDVQAAKLAFASDNGKIWLVLRPKIGATETKPAIVDKRSLMLGAIVAATRGRKTR